MDSPWYVPKKKKEKVKAVDAASDSGLSEYESSEDEEEADASGYTSESSNGWRRPIPTPLRRISASSRHRHRHHQQQQQQQQLRGVGGVSGFTVRLSPLMRSGASGRHSQVSESAGVSGELRYPANSVRRDRRTATGCAPLGLDPSRSWQLADFGRFK